MRNVLLLFLLALSTTVCAQTLDEYVNAKSQNSPSAPKPTAAIAPPATKEDKQNDNVQTARLNNNRGFLEFYIPSALFTFNVEPASISRVTFALTDTKFTFKYGKDFGKTKSQKGGGTSKLNNGWGFLGSGKLNDGARTLFSSDDVSREFSLKIIKTQVLRNTVYVLNGTDIYSSNRASWINLNINFDVNDRNVFTTDLDYTNRNNLNAQVLLTYNNLFSTLLDSYKAKRHIFNAGGGLGWFDNFESLDKYTLRKGIFNSTGGYLGESSAIVGRRGDFKRLFGTIAVVSAFKPLTKPEALTTLHVGGNATAFGLETNERIINATGGLFISHREFDEDDEEEARTGKESEKKLTEKFSFGLLAVFNQLQQVSGEGYGKKNFSIILTAQIPISFQ